MSIEFLVILVVAVLPALLAAAAVTDLATYTIPNAIPAAIILLFIPFAVVAASGGHGMSLNEAGQHVLAGVAGLTVGLMLFGAGWIGGGDAKLFAATLLWLGWGSLFDFAIAASILGGALTLALLALRQLPLPAVFMKQPWLAQLADPKAGVPYGVALALAALLVLPESRVFALAAAS